MGLIYSRGRGGLNSRGKRELFSWSQCWAQQSEVLFFGEISKITDGKLYNQKSGATDFLIVGGSAGSYTFQAPNTAAYIAADTDNIWFSPISDINRVVREANLIGYDFARTIVKYENTSPYSIEAIMILSSDVTTSKMRKDFQLSVWWDNTLSLSGAVKGNRGSEQSIWSGYEPETITYKTRVEADGGAITNIDRLDYDISFFKTIDVYDTLTKILLPYGGLKLRVVGLDSFVIKWYDFKGVAGDVVQATDGLQPKYGAANYNGYSVLTAASSMMTFTGVVIKTLITVSCGSEYLFGGGAGAYYRQNGPTTVAIRDNSATLRSFTVIDKAFRLESIISDGGNTSFWRNKNASVSNPLAHGAITFGTLFQRPTSTYFAGTAGVVLMSTSAITETTKGLIEDYYTTLFNIV